MDVVPQIDDVETTESGVACSKHHRGTTMSHYAGVGVSLEQASVCVIDASGKIVGAHQPRSRGRSGHLPRRHIMRCVFPQNHFDRQRIFNPFDLAGIASARQSARASQSYDETGNSIGTPNERTCRVQEIELRARLVRRTWCLPFFQW